MRRVRAMIAKQSGQTPFTLKQMRADEEMLFPGSPLAHVVAF